ncbi:GntR family transcriptional regulator [Kaistia dalseonensis]|uniref:GntR family transcriptional regulator n=1 Tax=Kaistia dalseonensis TaxID=410840 RepID=A0ABU0H591_9HYPH|nr:GntR family transcriptional regulator [Kaistia dalseonensis]MCX5494622.1 GntR family transcriptional regulator [Kaistia dalseonensis]MDQ0437202.1 GntR family transcriptional regulator [Kaistia dalseonensis]
MSSDPIVSLDRRRPEPLWHQAERAIRARIEAGEWPAGTRIPAEDRLCELLGVSRITVRHALRNLESLGLLRREHGRGTFVRSATVVAGLRGLTSFTEEMAALGLVVGSTLLSQEIIPADAMTSAALEIEEGEPVLRIRRLRLGNDAPIGVQAAHLRLDRVPGLIDEDLSKGSLYDRLDRLYGIQPTEATETYRVGAVDAVDAALLGVAPGSAAFVVERVTVDPRGPYEFTHSIMRGDRYEIRSTLRV